MDSVNQKSQGLYRSWRRERKAREKLSGGFGCGLGSVRQNADVCCCHAVPARILYQVHGLIGEVQQPLLGPRIGRIRGDTQARCHMDAQPVGVEPYGFTDELMKTACHVERIVLGGLRQEKHEFVAPVTEREIDQPAMGLESVANFREQARSHEMAMRVVYLLEMIQVDEHQGELVVIALRTVDFRLEYEAHVPGVIKAGAIVGDGQLVNSLYVPGVLGGGGG